MQPENFILNSDYATLRNDSSGSTASIIVPGSLSISAGGVREAHLDIAGGAAYGSSIRSRIRSSKLGSRWMAVPQIVLLRNGSAGPYSIIAYVYPIDYSIIRCSVIINNPYNVTMTSEAGAETFDFNVATFVPPFS